ncbi:hypothetical protein [Nostoc flagelliforme]|uniref:hypothetical protein n=1 Tax=Nostoc flagelliforme TaxID=1306274 RepID=UPI0016898FE8|nr:hypothetical protein [Nostoc flagelliforme]
MNLASWACVDTIQLDFDNQWFTFVALRHTIIAPNNSCVELFGAIACPAATSLVYGAWRGFGGLVGVGDFGCFVFFAAGVLSGAVGGSFGAAVSSATFNSCTSFEFVCSVEQLLF